VWLARAVRDDALHTAPTNLSPSITYGADSATRIAVRDSAAATERVATPKGFPVGALSNLSVDLALTRARQEHRDSTTSLLAHAEMHGST
jgi:hypothetical protein